MRTGTSQRAYQHEDMTLRMRRPPEEYVTLLSQNEQEFRNYVTSFEDNPMVSRLLDEGVMHRVQLRGKIPRGKYEEFMDQQLVDFLKEYDIVSFDGWERDFLSPSALNRVPELATKYHVPEGSLLRQLRYLRSSERGALPERAITLSSNVADDSRQFDQIENAPGSEMVDLAETIETTREFVERYGVSEQEFLDLILGGEATPAILEARFGCSRLEAEELLDATDRVYLAENLETQGRPAPRKSGNKSATVLADDPVAFVQMLEGRLAIQFDHDSIYTQRYRIRRDQKLDAAMSAVAREFLTRARFINQRLSALSRLITTLCQQQTDYLECGDMRRLKPLAQAELARQLGEHPSTVSRLIRGKTIDTPWGKMPLIFLCQSKTDVVARLIGEFPKLTDQDVVVRLRENYDCFIARRTVAYHRGKRVRRNRRHKTGDENTTAETAAAPASTRRPSAVTKTVPSRDAKPKRSAASTSEKTAAPIQAASTRGQKAAPKTAPDSTEKPASRAAATATKNVSVKTATAKTASATKRDETTASSAQNAATPPTASTRGGAKPTARVAATSAQKAANKNAVTSTETAAGETAAASAKEVSNDTKAAMAKTPTAKKAASTRDATAAAKSKKTATKDAAAAKTSRSANSKSQS